MTTTISQRLVARTVPLDHTPDLVAAAGRHGALWRDEHGGLATGGQAAVIPLPGGLRDPDTVRGVADALRSIEVHDERGGPARGPVAIGALPFDPAAPGQLVVPRWVLGRRHDEAWLTTIGPATVGPASTGPAGFLGGLRDAPGPLEEESPDGFTLSSPQPHAAWRRLIAETVEAIGTGAFDKVVLARRVDVTANRPFVIPEVLSRLIALYPSCMVFSVDGFIGASPELLIGRHGRTVTSHPLAGTVARSGDAASDDALVAALLGSAKDRQEHRLVVDSLAQALQPVCETLDVPDIPSVVGLRNVSHLGTTITGRLAGGEGSDGSDGSDGEPVPTALELVARVHPTPAVAGTPTQDAIAYLQSVESFDRGRYAGPVGWVDAHGDGAWALGIRSAEVDGPRAVLYAGAGVVAGSDPDAELAETQLKLQALLAALVRP